jgi:hypothetical protein
MDGEGHVSSARLLFRFGIGVTDLGGERLIAALRAFDALLPDDADARGPDRALAPRHALLGALAALPAAARGALARGYAATRPLRRGIARGRGLVSHIPGARRARRLTEDWRARAEAQLVRWALAGRREEISGRALAATAIRTAAHELVSAVAESPELKHVIAEQSESLGESAMAELREGTARADALAERMARRLLGRSR